MFGMRGSGMGKVDTMLGEGAELKGNLHDKGSIYVDGRVEGNVNSDDGVEIGLHGSLKGNIYSKNVVVGGKVTGNIHAVNKVELLATASVEGDIQTAKLVMAEGAVFEGHCEMEEAVEAGEVKVFKKTGA